MRNNVFRFRNSFYRQRNRVAIGVLLVSNVATQFLTFYNIISMILMFCKHLKADVRFLDDKFRI